MHTSHSALVAVPTKVNHDDLTSTAASAAAIFLQATELEALVSKALTAALAEEQYARGIVIDGVGSQYLSPELAANLLLNCLGLHKSCETIVDSAPV